jgi:imidazole glycerol-phosphate synthase subunit HisF
MIKKRIIPLLLVKNDNINYKGTNFNCWRAVGNVINAIKIFNHREADELILLDVVATNNKRFINIDIVEHIAANFNMPLTVGGGIQNINDASELFRHGADRICINTACYENIGLVKEVCDKFGKQALIVAIDYKKINGDYYCFSNNCTVNQNILVIDWINQIIEGGCGEILLTSYDHEGLMKGMDEEFLKKYNDQIDVSIIFGGGVGNTEHTHPILKYKNVNALSIGSLFNFTQYTPNDIKKKCEEHDILVRFVN